MAKALSVEQQLSALVAIRPDPKSALARAELERGLTSKSNLVVAKAATIIQESRQSTFLPALVTAFDRLFPPNSDKGCLAKTAIAAGLYEMGSSESGPFLRGIRHVQPEPGFGTSRDSAAELRGLCGLGLARMGYPDVLLELAAILVDAEPQTRITAARAVAYTGSDAGSPLLRMKVLAGDTEPEVTAECLLGLMKLSPRKSLPFVARFLRSDDGALAEAAAQAIGSWRSSEAFEFLRAEWESHLRPEPRRSLLLGMALTRQPAAIEFLLQRVKGDRPLPAADAILAMSIYKNDKAIVAQLTQIVSQQNDPVINAAYQKVFGN